MAANRDLGRAALIVELQREAIDETRDAGHLAIQELVVRTGRRAGFAGSFELATKPSEPWRSTDVGMRDDRRRLLCLIECWNTIADVGAAARSSERKRAEAEMFAVAIGGEHSYRVASCRVVRATKRNRMLVARYPKVFAARFPGSSRCHAPVRLATRIVTGPQAAIRTIRRGPCGRSGGCAWSATRNRRRTARLNPTASAFGCSMPTGRIEPSISPRR